MSVPQLSCPDFNDFWWDTAEPESRDQAVLKQAIQTARYAKEQVPFYQTHYRHISNSDIESISTLDEFMRKLPYITKEHLSKNHPSVFLPRQAPDEIDPNMGKYWAFGTGGSTSKPVLVFHSMEDWRGMAKTANRHIEFDFYQDSSIYKHFDFERNNAEFAGQSYCVTPLSGCKILGAYNADHITNAIYRTMLLHLGAELFGRPSAAPTLEDIYDAAQYHKVNGILAPPGGGNQTKGAFLESLLRVDAHYTNEDQWDLSHRYNKDFKFVFWSSMPIARDLLEYLVQDCQMPYVKGHFGSTEVCPTAASCSVHMRNFHLAYGNSMVLIKSLEQDEMAQADELGYILVSKIGAVNKQGKPVVPSGMFFINYMTGDGARLSRDGEQCGCGRNTPVLYDIQRMTFQRGKALHGCQMD